MGLYFLSAIVVLLYLSKMIGMVYTLA